MADEEKIITEEEKKRLTEQVTGPILKEAEERMVAGVRTRKPVKPLTRQEQIEATPEGQAPQRLRPGAPTTERIELPTTLPQHGIKALYNDGERILERASQITNLPPESPFTHTIAQRIAKGDPFSSEAMDDAKKETMKLVRAGVIPNPFYEGFTGKVQQAYEMFAPLVVEVGLPMAQGIATSPLLISPVPGSRVGYFSALGLTSGVANMWAQQMRIGYGHQEETSYQEAAAAMAWGMIPGLKTGKDMSKAATVVLRGFEGAVMAGGENATHQGLELLYGKRGEFKVGELGLTSAGGAAIGAVLGRLESALVKYEPKEKAAPLLRKAIKDELRGVKKEIARLKKDGQMPSSLKMEENWAKRLEDKLEALREPEDKILQRAIDELEEFEQQQVEAIELYAKEFQQSEAARVLKESDIQAKEQAGVSRAFLEYDEGTNPDWVGSMGNPHYKNVYNPETQRTAYMNKKGEIIDLSADTPIQVDRTLEKLSDDELEETLRVAKNDRDDLENWEDDSLVPDGDLEKVIEARSKVEALELEQWRRDVAWRAEDFVKNPEEAAADPFNDLFGKVWEEVKLDNDMANVKVAMAFEAIKKHKLEGKFRDFLKIQQRFLGSQVEAEDAEFLFETQMKKAVAAYKKFSQPQPKPEAPTPKPEVSTFNFKQAEATEDAQISRGNLPELGQLGDLVKFIGIEGDVKSMDDINKLMQDPANKDKLLNFLQDNPIEVSHNKALKEATGEAFYEITDGNHRYELAKMAGIDDIPVSAKSAEEIGIGVKQPTIEAPTPKPEGEVKQQAREALDDFMAGGGTRDVDPETGKIKDTEDEVKARLLTSDVEKQRLINSVQDAIKEDLKNVKGGREGQVEYLAKVQRELDRRLGTDMGEEFALVLKAAQLSDNIEVADAINELSIQMSANGAIMVKGFDDLLKLTREKDFNDVNSNDFEVAARKLIPQMLGWKKAGSAAGRLLQSRKYTKDQLEMKVEELEAQLEENLVSDLKASKDMTPEELDKQIKTFGDLEARKRLFKAVQQANDVSEVKDILIKQQQAFQNKSTLKKNFEQGNNLYTKVRDAGMDVLYSSMLSAPTTLIKVGLGNAVMSRYNSWMGKVGAKYMAIAPWARRGMTKQQFEEAYDFWARVSTTYGEFNDIALQEARKAFKSGISDLRSHFERVGESALSMERTGIGGALGQSIENVGQFIDVPGKAMAAVDARSRMRIAHAMTKAKAVYDYRMAKANGEEVPDNFDAYYKGFLNRVFTEDGTRLMTEDQARRQAILNAEKEGVKAENMASYIENYLKNNWDKNTSNFVDYVQRNVKEVTFTDELGEFANMTWLEQGALKPIESLLASFPLLKTIISPFQRTGRNIIREGLSSTSALADVPGIRKFSDKIWAKTTQDLNSGDPIVAARAKGRQIIGAGVIATAWGMAEAGLYEGMIGQNWKKRENVQIGTGLSDYQLRIPVGDEVLAQDINALEPFATIMNIVADIHTLSKGSMSQRKEAMTALGILQLVVSNNIGNKSYFKNLGDAIELVTATSESEEALDAKRSRLLKGMFGSAVPSGMNALSMATDEFRRRSDNMMQLLGKRLGGIAREVPPYRDMFGDPQPLHKTDRLKAFSLFNPFRVSKQIMDVEDYVVTDKDGLRSFNKEKLASIDLKDEEAVRNAAWAIAIELDGEYHFNGGTTTKDGVDLQEIIHPETRIDAFEAWQKEYQTIKLSGLNVKQATVLLGKKLTTPSKLNPNKAPEGFKQEDVRLKKLNEMLGKFREAAYKKVKVQYPVLMEQEKENKVRNVLLTTSPTAEQLERITSEMPVEEYKKTQPNTRLQELLGKTPYKPVTLD